MTTSRQPPLIPPAEPAHRPATGAVRLLVFNAQAAMTLTLALIPQDASDQ